LYPQVSRASVVDQAWERIGVTGNHPIWSEDRHDYVAAMDLRVGERLKNLSGDTVWVQQKLPRPGPTPVYNLEVQDEHVYYVGANGVLAHNAGEECDRFADVKKLKGRQRKNEFNNSRIKKLKKQMQREGFDSNHPIEVVMVDGKMIIWDGHHRARAAGAAGISRVPIRELKKTPEEMMELWSQAAEAAQSNGLPF
jgi:hypothetical protein